MTPPLLPPPPRRRRRVWPWLLAIFLTPVLLLGIAAASYLTLDRDAAVLRREVMAATDTPWHTRIQLSLGRLTLWTVRTGLAFVPDPQVEEARAVLQAVKSVSVGVYRLEKTATDWSHEKLFENTDRQMNARGWSRLVGVVERRARVLIYTPADDDSPRRLCLAVVQGRELVVVAARIDPEALARILHAFERRRAITNHDHYQNAGPSKTAQFSGRNRSSGVTHV